MRKPASETATSSPDNWSRFGGASGQGGDGGGGRAAAGPRSAHDRYPVPTLARPGLEHALDLAAQLRSPELESLGAGPFLDRIDQLRDLGPLGSAGPLEIDTPEVSAHSLPERLYKSSGPADR